MATETEPVVGPDTKPANNDDGPLTHRYCVVCYPDVSIGDEVRAACGIVKTVHRMRSRPPARDLCVVCEDLHHEEVLDCGHPGRL